MEYTIIFDSRELLTLIRVYTITWILLNDSKTVANCKTCILVQHHYLPSSTTYLQICHLDILIHFNHVIVSVLCEFIAQDQEE